MSAGLRARCSALVVLALLATAAGVSAAQESLEELSKRLKRGDDAQRRSAVQALAALGGEEAWKLVLGALRDPKAMVADQAQLELGRTREPRALAALFGRDGLGAGDRLLRERVAELVGRLPAGLQAGPVAKALPDKDARVRRLLCWSVERQAREGRLSEAEGAELERALERLLAREDEPGVRAAVWSARWALGALAEERLEKEPFLERDPEVRGAAVLALATLPAERAGRALAARLAEEHASVRALAVEGLAALADAPAARALAEQLAKESEKRLAWRIVEHLRSFSGLRFGRDARPWREWAGTLPDDWSAREARRGAGGAREDGESVAFAGLSLLSERVLLLVDLSGSMGEARDGGPTRKERAQAELARMLAAAPPTVRFDLVPYAAEPRPWKGTLVAATKESAAQAELFLERQRTGGPGDLWKALVAALAVPELDTVLVWGDGAPSGGQHWNLELIGALWAEATRFRPLVLDAVLVRPGSVERHWRRMCEASGGRLLILD